jgi:hypothetical protein
MEGCRQIRTTGVETKGRSAVEVSKKTPDAVMLSAAAHPAPLVLSAVECRIPVAALPAEFLRLAFHN